MARVIVNTPFEYLSEAEAMKRTPYKTTKTFRSHYGDLFRSENEGDLGGYLASDLQARTESFSTRERK
ncbi:MAG: hypothetical protein SOI15_02895 [Bifidobacterium crudilactis]|jgi:hypothetical protein|nr:hypothetical protein [Bifidobacterium crudilactis]